MLKLCFPVAITNLRYYRVPVRLIGNSRIHDSLCIFRAQRGKSTRWRLRQRTPPTGLDETTYRGAGAQWRETLRHLAHTTGV